MSSIIGWNQIEPVARDQSFREGLESTIYDPAWTLARQWQIGEFQGEDAGSAVLARIAMRARPVTHYRPGPPGSAAAPVALDEARPLEALVETETAADFGATGWLDRSEAGVHFLRLLDVHPALPEERAGWIASHGFPSLPADAVLSATHGASLRRHRPRHPSVPARPAPLRRARRPARRTARDHGENP
ncbi:hypothetical protein G5B40_06590 [Pikeienuella piscinae]|uniref:Uncharacterized protein n=1 Tax=Pikeienuella piscinae TaxID=2748098 RepID=A0A7L5BY34_9RHOB|nr:hypothetical protein G5B40_06590 [Pikeienuella piscinae]